MKHLIITIHGIRTFGDWQERLEQLLEAEHAAATNDELPTVFNYKYGYFSVIAFLIPVTRWLVVRRFRQEFLKQANTRKWDRIDIVAHSFGTHLVGWGLRGIPKSQRPPVHTIVLAGSVLKPSFRWLDLTDSGLQRLINDCGIYDRVLILNKLVVLFTGMAGRNGFTGMTGSNFRNRFFSFGHSGYFLGTTGPDNAFMKANWVPLLIGNSPITLFPDPRHSSAIRGLITFFLNNIEPIKLAVYATPIIALFSFYHSLYTKAAEKAAEVVRNRARADFIVADQMINAGQKREALMRLARAVRVDPHNLAAGRRILFLLLQQPWFVPAPAGEVQGELPPNLSDPLAARRRAESEMLVANRLRGKRENAIVAVSESGSQVAIASDKKIEWLDNSPQPQKTTLVNLDFSIEALKFSPDEDRLVAVGGFGGEFGHHADVAVIYKGDPSARTKQLDRSPPNAVEFSPDGRLFITAGTLWDTRGPEELGNFFQDGKNISFSANGRTVTIDGSRWVQIGRLPISKAPGEDPADKSEFIDRGSSPDGAYALSGRWPSDEVITLINSETGHTVPLPESMGYYRSFVFTSDSQRVAAIHEDGGGLVWDLATTKIVGRFSAPPGSWVRAAAGKLILTHSFGAPTLLWDSEKGGRIGQPIPAEVISAAFYPDGERLLLITHDGVGRLWNIAKAAWVSDSVTLTNTESDVMLSPDGSCFATSATDGGAGLGNFQLWDTDTMRPLSLPTAGSEILGKGGESAALGAFRFTSSWRLFFSAGPEGRKKEARYFALDVPSSDETVPLWLADLAETVSGLEPRAKTLAAIREAASHAEDTWSVVIRWWLDESPARTISPRSAVKVTQYVQRRLTSTTLNDLVLAGRAAPENRAVFERLAAVAAKDEWSKGIALAAGRRARWLGARTTAVSVENRSGVAPPRVQGDAEALFARGNALRKGEGVERNLTEAVTCYRRAAELGHASAQHRLGVIYAAGAGVVQNDVEAVEWYRKAAQQGLAEAQYDLGVRCILGRGTPKDERAGIDWYRKAAAQGWQEAIEALQQRGISAGD